MTRPHTLPLDGDALDRAEGHVVAVGFVRAGLVDDLLAQSRAALALEAERDALKAQVERMRLAMEWARHFIPDPNSDDPCLQCSSYPHHPLCSYNDMRAKFSAALRATPAQSLAAHDAEVRAKALREAAALAVGYDPARGGIGTAIQERILALAERAPEVER